jgi:hypothetical protein
MATTDFPDFDGVRRALQNPLPPGQALMAASRPVVLASDQSAIPVTGTVNVSGTIPVSGVFWQTTQPVSIAALPALAAGTALIGKIGLDQSTPGTTNAFSLSYLGSAAVASGNGVVGAGVQRVAIASDNSAIPTNVSQFGGNAANLGAGAVGTGTLRITQASDSPEIAALGAPADAAWASGNGTHTALLKTIATQALSTAAVPIAMADEYETVAASATDQVIGTTGATGDRLAGILIQPGTTSPGNVIIKDNATTIFTFPGGASSVSNLATIPVPLGIKSVSGAWKITTGANVTVIAIGDFT